MTKLLTREETRIALGGRSTSQFYRDLKAGRIPAPRYIGSRPYWKSDEIEALIEGLPSTPDIAA